MAELPMKKWNFLFAVACFFACVQPAPKPALSEEKLAQIMADCFVVEAALQTASARERDSLSAVFYPQVFDIHGVTKESYEKDVEILSLHPARLDSVLSQALRLLEVKK